MDSKTSSDRKFNAFYFNFLRNLSHNERNRIYLILYFRDDLSKMEYLVLIIIYLTLYFREDLSKMEYFVLIIIYLTLPEVES
jgi:hypothetical protein